METENEALARIFLNMARIYSMKNDNRSKAYEKASDIMWNSQKEYMTKEGAMNIKGIGPSIGSQIEEFNSNGFVEKYEELKKEVINFVEVPKMELEYNYPLTLLESNLIINSIKQRTNLTFERVGCNESECREIDIVLLKDESMNTLDKFISDLGDKVLIIQKKRLGSVTLVYRESDYLYPHTMKIIVVNSEEYPFTIFWFNSTPRHILDMKARAAELGAKLTRRALLTREGKVVVQNEREIYQVLGVEYVPPENR